MEIDRIPFHIDLFNLITNGGIPRKTLNVILAGTNVGKSMMMVDLSANYLLQGLNVLYITLEMSEEAIANRIDANLMNMPMKAVDKQDADVFMKKIDRLQSSTNGKLIVKEFPTSGAHVGHFRNLIQELKLKKNFTPDVICVDYINIMSSSRVKLANTNSYFYIKAIAEELRGLAVELNVPIWSATQSNRSGQNDSDIDITNTSESFGLPATVDFMFAVIRNEELDRLGQLMIKQLKSRYGNKNYYEKFVIGVDPDKMKLYDAEDSAQTLVQSDGSVGLPSGKDDLKF
jgi:replicative DNA helicase